MNALTPPRNGRLQQRMQDTSTPGKGVESIASPHLRQVFDALSQGNVWLAECDVALPGDPRRTQKGSALQVPFVTTVVEATEPGEGQAINPVDMSFGLRTLTRHEIRSRVDGSLEFLEDSVDQGASVERHLLVRTGMRELTAITPDILTDVVDSGITPAALSRANVLALKDTLDPAYQLGAVWMVNPANMGTLRGTSDAAAGSWDNPLTDADWPRLEGHRVIQNRAMPTTGANSLLFGNLRWVVIDYPMPPSIRVLTESTGLMDSGKMAWLVMSRIGAALTVGDAIKGLNVT